MSLQLIIGSNTENVGNSEGISTPTALIFQAPWYLTYPTTWVNYVFNAKIYIKKWNNPSSDVSVSLYNCDMSSLKPTGSPLSTGTISISSVTSSYAWYTVNFTPFQITASLSDYWRALVVSCTLDPANEIVWDGSTGNAGLGLFSSQMIYSGGDWYVSAGWPQMFEIWGADSLTIAPTVINTGVSNVTTTNIDLNGNLTSNGGASTDVKIYWGKKDGGNNPANWDSVIDFGVLPQGTFSTTI
jgi:hypothetical protein